MTIQTSYRSSGTPTHAEDLQVGTRVLIGIDTKAVLKVTPKADGTVSVKTMKLGKITAYYTFPANRTLFVY